MNNHYLSNKLFADLLIYARDRDNVFTEIAKSLLANGVEEKDLPNHYWRLAQHPQVVLNPLTDDEISSRINRNDIEMKTSVSVEMNDSDSTDSYGYCADEEYKSEKTESCLEDGKKIKVTCQTENILEDRTKSVIIRSGTSDGSIYLESDTVNHLSKKVSSPISQGLIKKNADEFKKLDQCKSVEILNISIQDNSEIIVKAFDSLAQPVKNSTINCSGCFDHPLSCKEKTITTSSNISPFNKNNFTTNREILNKEKRSKFKKSKKLRSERSKNVERSEELGAVSVKVSIDLARIDIKALGNLLQLVHKSIISKNETGANNLFIKTSTPNKNTTNNSVSGNNNNLSEKGFTGATSNSSGETICSSKNTSSYGESGKNTHFNINTHKENTSKNNVDSVLCVLSKTISSNGVIGTNNLVKSSEGGTFGSGISSSLEIDAEHPEPKETSKTTAKSQEIHDSESVDSFKNVFSNGENFAKKSENGLEDEKRLELPCHLDNILDVRQQVEISCGKTCDERISEEHVNDLNNQISTTNREIVTQKKKDEFKISDQSRNFEISDPFSIRLSIDMERINDQLVDNDQQSVNDSAVDENESNAPNPSTNTSILCENTSDNGVRGKHTHSIEDSNKNEITKTYSWSKTSITASENVFNNNNTVSVESSNKKVTIKTYSRSKTSELFSSKNSNVCGSNKDLIKYSNKEVSTSTNSGSKASIQSENTSNSIVCDNSIDLIVCSNKEDINVKNASIIANITSKNISNIKVTDSKLNLIECSYEENISSTNTSSNNNIPNKNTSNSKASGNNIQLMEYSNKENVSIINSSSKASIPNQKTSESKISDKNSESIERSYKGDITRNSNNEASTPSNNTSNCKVIDNNILSFKITDEEYIALTNSRNVISINTPSDKVCNNNTDLIEFSGENETATTNLSCQASDPTASTLDSTVIANSINLIDNDGKNETLNTTSKGEICTPNRDILSNGGSRKYINLIENCVTVIKENLININKPTVRHDEIIGVPSRSVGSDNRVSNQTTKHQQSKIDGRSVITNKSTELQQIKMLQEKLGKHLGENVVFNKTFEQKDPTSQSGKTINNVKMVVVLDSGKEPVELPPLVPFSNKNNQENKSSPVGVTQSLNNHPVKTVVEKSSSHRPINDSECCSSAEQDTHDPGKIVEGTQVSNTKSKEKASKPKKSKKQSSNSKKNKSAESTTAVNNNMDFGMNAFYIGFSPKDMMLDGNMIIIDDDDPDLSVRNKLNHKRFMNTISQHGDVMIIDDEEPDLNDNNKPDKNNKTFPPKLQSKDSNSNSLELSRPNKRSTDFERNLREFTAQAKSIDEQLTARKRSAEFPLDDVSRSSKLSKTSSTLNNDPDISIVGELNISKKNNQMPSVGSSSSVRSVNQQPQSSSKLNPILKKTLTERRSSVEILEKQTNSSGSQIDKLYSLETTSRRISTNTIIPLINDTTEPAQIRTANETMVNATIQNVTNSMNEFRTCVREVREADTTVDVDNMMPPPVSIEHARSTQNVPSISQQPRDTFQGSGLQNTSMATSGDLSNQSVIPGLSPEKLEMTNKVINLIMKFYYNQSRNTSETLLPAVIHKEIMDYLRSKSNSCCQFEVSYEDRIRLFLTMYTSHFNGPVNALISKLAEHLHLYISDFNQFNERRLKARSLNTENLMVEEIKHAKRNHDEMLRLRGRNFGQLYQAVMSEFRLLHLSMAATIYFKIVLALLNIDSENSKYIPILQTLCRNLISNSSCKFPQVAKLFNLSETMFNEIYIFIKLCLVALHALGYHQSSANNILEFTEYLPSPINLSQLKNCALNNQRDTLDQAELPSNRRLHQTLQLPQDIVAESTELATIPNVSNNISHQHRFPGQNIVQPKTRSFEAEMQQFEFNQLSHEPAPVTSTQQQYTLQNQQQVEPSSHFPQQFYQRQNNLQQNQTANRKQNSFQTSQQQIPSNLKNQWYQQHSSRILEKPKLQQPEQNLSSKELSAMLSSQSTSLAGIQALHNQITQKPKTQTVVRQTSQNSQRTVTNNELNRKIENPNVKLPSYSDVIRHKNYNVQSQMEQHSSRVTNPDHQSHDVLRQEAPQPSNTFTTPGTTGDTTEKERKWICDNPGCEYTPTLVCKLCCNKYYCSPNCQTEDWFNNSHKDLCLQ